jgi:hypothetical protein
VGRNVILHIDFPEVDRNLSLSAPDGADDKNEEKSGYEFRSQRVQNKQNSEFAKERS